MGAGSSEDGHRAYIQEAGQRDYHIPAVWADRLEDKVELRVKATVGEWANILMMPSYHTLATYQPLTGKFRTAYVGVVHDVMLRRLKKAAYKYAQEIERQVDELSAEEEKEEPPLPSVPRSTSKPLGKMSEQPTASSPEADVFRVYKKIKTLDTTVPQMDQAVISYDLEQQFYEERRKKETGQGAKPPTKASVKAPANPPNRPPLQRREEPQRRFYGPPALQGPQKKSTFLPREEYNKLSSEEKKALYKFCRSGTGGPAK
ncbi:hypothetical protein XENOCAPTIV_024614 [Xenoophorus captivus]|uniref:Uncharacterized protein n=1 Tax=Xenoophorus captivus TaxID=1517983 RepID=A0ABV0S0M8_9TELE